MNEREWKTVKSTHDAVQALSLRFVIIEEQVGRWRSREKWVNRTVGAALIGFAFWLLQSKFHF